MVILLSLLVCLVGVLMYALSVTTKVCEIGRIMFAFGLLVFLLKFGPEIVTLFK